MELADLVPARDALKPSKLIKLPIVHFALLGLVLFLLTRWLFPSEPDQRASDSRIVISEARVAALVGQYEATSGLEVTHDTRAALVQRFAEEEMLLREAHRWGLAENNEAIDRRLRQIMAFVSGEEHSDDELERQARALGMDSKDVVIRNMLVHNMRLLLATKGEQAPSDEEVAAYYERERSRFARPIRMTGWHVFFSRELGRSSSAAALAAKTKLDGDALKPSQAVALGDVYPSGARFKGQLAHQLASRFGEDLAEAAGSLPEGQWSDPIATPFGAHLLLIEQRTQPEAPPLNQIRARVTAAYRSKQREERLATAMDDLRARYEIVVE